MTDVAAFMKMTVFVKKREFCWFISKRKMWEVA